MRTDPIGRAALPLDLPRGSGPDPGQFGCGGPYSQVLDESDPDAASEAGGLLLGKAHSAGVEISGFAPWLRGEKSGPDFVLSDTDKLVLKDYIEELNGLGDDLSVVGYFRSDFRKGISLGEADLSLIREFFSGRSNVFLVVQPSKVPEPVAGFFFWDGDSIFSFFSFREFIFDEAKLPASAETNSVAVPEEAGAAPILLESDQSSEAVATLEPAPAPVGTAPNKASRNPWPLRRWAMVVGIAVALISASAYLLVPKSTGRYTVAQQFPPVQLSVSRSEGDIKISWNGQAPQVTAARAGLVTITDGNLQHDVALTPTQLQSSRLVYAPRTDRVQITLEIFTNNGGTTHDEMMLLLNPGTPPTTAASVTQRVEVSAQASPVLLPKQSEFRASQATPAREFVLPIHRPNSRGFVGDVEPAPVVSPAGFGRAAVDTLVAANQPYVLAAGPARQSEA